MAGLDFTKLKSRKKATPKAKPPKMYKEVEQVKNSSQTNIIQEVTQPKTRKTTTKVAQQATQQVAQQKKKTPAKVGRKSWKKAGVNYTRMAFDTPIDTKQKLKELLAVKFFGKFISQDEMINAALDEFIKKHNK